MLRNTAAKIRELRKGDRFYFVSDTKRIAYQVTSETFISKVSYNIISADGKALWPFDKQAAHDRPVIFLRHTVQEPGEECRIEDLRDGDIFHLSDNIIDEYQMIAVVAGTNEATVIKLPGEQCFVARNTTVFYIGKLELKNNNHL